jgi:hypothetical protein
MVPSPLVNQQMRYVMPALLAIATGAVRIAWNARAIEACASLFS